MIFSQSYGDEVLLLIFDESLPKIDHESTGLVFTPSFLEKFGVFQQCSSTLLGDIFHNVNLCIPATCKGKAKRSSNTATPAI